jgi:hypothetical protein
MGLLDDAIREHLELKRLRGADPGEVAREQREALDPVPRERSDELVQDASDADLAGVPLEGDSPASESGLDAGLAEAGETAELDMESVLGGESREDAAEEQPSDSADGRRAEGAPEDAVVDEDLLEWEVPADASAASAPAAADAGDDGDYPTDTGESDPEDVLEETPEFLRDTPEQERLWFEQRPPRDFDFDK